LLSAPAQAAGGCTVPGGQLSLQHVSGYNITVTASGPQFGPAAVISTREGTFDGSVLEGGITGRSIVFNVGTGGKSYVHYEGVVDSDGIARGTSSGIAQPFALQSGEWSSDGPLTCN
jgi:hypothetical protein